MAPAIDASADQVSESSQASDHGEAAEDESNDALLSTLERRHIKLGHLVRSLLSVEGQKVCRQIAT